MDASKPVTQGFLRTIIDGLVAELAGKFTAHRDRLAELERRVAELEGRQIRYVGTFESGRQYRRGEMVTDKGCVWHCNADTSTRPGDSDNWTLAVKRGADGRDAR